MFMLAVRVWEVVGKVIVLVWCIVGLGGIVIAVANQTFQSASCMSQWICHWRVRRASTVLLVGWIVYVSREGLGVVGKVVVSVWCVVGLGGAVIMVAN